MKMQAQLLEPHINPKFIYNKKIPIDESIEAEYYYSKPPTGPPTATNPSITIDVEANPHRFVDLANSYLQIGIKVDATGGISPAMLIALSHNATMFLFANMQLKINNVMVENQTMYVGEYNTMLNSLIYSDSYSSSDSALYDLCWCKDDHSFYTTVADDGTTVQTPSTAITTTIANTISGGCSNACNNIPFAVNPGAIVETTKRTAPIIKCVNEKYSSGFAKRHNLLFNGLNGTLQSVSNGFNGILTFKIPLKHMFLFCRTISNYLRGCIISLVLCTQINTGNSQLCKMFVMDRSDPATVTTNAVKNYTTYPDSGVPGNQMGPGDATTTNLNLNYTTGWNVEAIPAIGTFTVTPSNVTLYLRCLTPRASIMAQLQEQFLASDVSSIYRYMRVSYGQIGVPATSSTQGLQVSQGDIVKPRWLIFAFQQQNPQATGGVGGGGRTIDGTSNYSTFDCMDLKTAQLMFYRANYPTTTIDASFQQKNVGEFFKLIKTFRDEVVAAEDGKESAPMINLSNWFLYPIYLIDLRAQIASVTDVSTPQSASMLLNLYFNSVPKMPSTLMYMFVGDAAIECTDSSCTRLF